MSTWMIPMDIIIQSEKHARQSFVSGNADIALRGTTLTLFSKNTLRCYRFRNACPMPAHYAYLAERKTVPNYFSKVILPYEMGI